LPTPWILKQAAWRGMRVILRADQNPANEGAVETTAALFAFPKESTMPVDLSGLSFYRASFYAYMIEEEDLDL